MSPPHIPEMGILAIIGQLPTLLLKPSVPVVLMCLGPLSCLERGIGIPVYAATLSENPPFCQYGRPDSTGPSLPSSKRCYLTTQGIGEAARLLGFEMPSDFVGA